MHRRALVALAALLTGLGALVGAVLPAAAHGSLVEARPADGGTAEGPDTPVQLVFTEPPAGNGWFVLRAPDGSRVDAGWAATQSERLDEPVQELHLVDGAWEPVFYDTGYVVDVAVSHWPAQGQYELEYRHRASDGELVEGTARFVYAGEPTPAPAGWTAPTDQPDPSLLLEQGSGDPGEVDENGAVVGPTLAPTAEETVAAAGSARPDGSGSWLPWLVPAVLVLAVGAVLVGAARRPTRTRATH